MATLTVGMDSNCAISVRLNALADNFSSEDYTARDKIVILGRDSLISITNFVQAK